MICCTGLMLIVFFFFKQKTAYEMRISDWSSDVCSSDLMKKLLKNMAKRILPPGVTIRLRRRNARLAQRDNEMALLPALGSAGCFVDIGANVGRSEERRVGKECVSTGRSRCAPNLSKNK